MGVKRAGLSALTLLSLDMDTVRNNFQVESNISNPCKLPEVPGVNNLLNILDRRIEYLVE